MPLPEIGGGHPPVDRLMVSVVVPCRNEVRHIEGFLESVVGQEHGDFDIEVLVADGMSDDGTREILAKHAAQFPWIRVIDNPEQIVSTGLNRAIGRARGGIIVRMDVHTDYPPDYVRQCVAVLDETGADNVGGPAQTRPEGYVARAVAGAYHSPFSCGGARFHDPNYEGPVDTVTYGCWRKSTLERVGLFDETLVRNQDDELNLRLLRSGGRIWQSPRIRSWYRPRNSLVGLFRQYFQYGFWKVAVIRKHRLPASWRHVIPGASVLTGLALPAAAAICWAAGSATGAWLMAVWATLVALYSAAVAAASVLAARRHGWALLPVLPVIFAAYHVSYGVGFLAGLAYFPFCTATPKGTHPIFKEITR